MPEQNDQCTLFGDFGYIVQFALGLVCFFSLIIKWLKESDRRPFQIFFMDVSKQGFSASLAHIMNLMIAVFLSRETDENPCVWYFINIMIDTTIGVFVAYLFIRAVQAVALYYEWEMLMTGHYMREGGDEIDLAAWASQLIVWNTIIIITKSILAGAQEVFEAPLGNLGKKLFESIDMYPRFELVVVMFIVPL